MLELKRDKLSEILYKYRWILEMRVLNANKLVIVHAVCLAILYWVPLCIVALPGFINKPNYPSDMLL